MWVKARPMHMRNAWGRVQDCDVEFGAAAYRMYNAAMRKFSEFYGTGLVQTTEAFVALSPNNDYHGNLRSLAAVLFAHAAKIQFHELTISTYRACGDRAMSYVTGNVSFLDTVTGPKITAFRHNILYPESSKLATIDGHMIALWEGRSLTMKEAAAALKGATMYSEIAGEVRRIALQAGKPVPEVQATLWSLRKRELGIRFSTQGELFSGMTRWLEVPDPIDYPPFQIGRWREWLQQKDAQNVQEA